MGGEKPGFRITFRPNKKFLEKSKGSQEFSDLIREFAATIRELVKAKLSIKREPLGVVDLLEADPDLVKQNKGRIEDEYGATIKELSPHDPL